MGTLPVARSRNARHGRLSSLPRNVTCSVAMIESHAPFWETVHALSSAVASELQDAGVITWLFPVLTVLGPGVLVHLGLRGIRKQSTIESQRVDQRLVVTEVTGHVAVVVGVLQLALAALLFAVLAPLTASLLGLW